MVALRDKVKIEPDASLSPSRAKIRVLTKDGRALEKSMDTLDLSKDRKKLKQDLTRKFRDLSSPILGKEKTEKLMAKVGRLEKARSLSALANLAR